MNENLRKALHYFLPWDYYWSAPSEKDKLKVQPGPFGRYPLDFKPRLAQGHYFKLDNNSVPMWHNSDKSGFIYHYTTMCSYALACYDLYLLTGSVDESLKTIAVADYIVSSGIDLPEGFLLKEPDDRGIHNGNISAMAQGEAISVLCRAYWLTKNEIYKAKALECSNPFRYEIDKNGVVGFFSKIKNIWYEEYVSQPLRHVLNGMIYSLWGLRDLHITTGDFDSKVLYNKGVNSLALALPLFDTGYWSYYRVAEAEKNYVASIMYHNLHIVQLQGLYKQTSNKIFLEYAKKFKSYIANPFNRAKAALSITRAKLKSA